MPPYWLTTRVISRMTDSVNPCTRWEIGIPPRRAVPRGPPAMAGTIATASPSFQRGRLAARGSGCPPVHVDIDEAAQLAALVDQAPSQAGKLLEVADHVP